MLFSAVTTRAAIVSFTFTNNVGQADTNWFLAVPVDTNVLAGGSVITRGIPIRLTPNASGYVQTNLQVGHYRITNPALSRDFLIRVPNDSGPTIYCGTCSTEDASTNLAISGLNRFITISYGSNSPPTLTQVTNLFGFLPLSPTVTTNVANAAAAAATNGYTTLATTNPAAVLYTNHLPTLTNGFVKADVTNGLATTNYVMTRGFVTSSVTNGLATTNYVVDQVTGQGFVTSTVTNGLATTNYVMTRGFVTGTVTNGLATLVHLTNYVGGQGFVTATVTNGLATTNYVMTRGFVTASVTNGLATTNYVVTQVTGQGFVTAGVTNGLATLIFVTNYVASFGGSASDTNGLAHTNYVNNATNDLRSAVVTFVNNATSNSLRSMTINATNDISSILQGKLVSTNDADALNLSNTASLYSGGAYLFSGTHEGSFTLKDNRANQNLVSNQWAFGIVGSNVVVSYTRNTTNDLPATAFIWTRDGAANASLSLYISRSETNNLAFTNWAMALESFGTNFAVTNFTDRLSNASNVLRTATINATNDLRTALQVRTVTTNFLMAANPVFTVSSNIINIFGAGSGEVNGGSYETNSTLGCFTNATTHFIISFQNPTWFLQWPGSGVNSTNMYSASDPWVGPWSVVAGTGPAPTSSPGYIFNLNGAVIQGAHGSWTNLIAILNQGFGLASALSNGPITWATISTNFGGSTNLNLPGPSLDLAANWTPGVNTPQRRTPIMGFSTWPVWGQTVYSSNIYNTVTWFRTNGMFAAGYVYPEISLGWQQFRNASRVLIANTNTIPEGLTNLIANLRTNGLKPVLYTETREFLNGYPTLPGIRGCVEIDATAWASIGVEGVKLDAGLGSGGGPTQENEARLIAMTFARLNKPFWGWVNPNAQWYLPWMSGWFQQVHTGPVGGTDLNGPSDATQAWTNFVFHFDYLLSVVPHYTGPGKFVDGDYLPVQHWNLLLNPAQNRSAVGLYSFLPVPLVLDGLPASVPYAIGRVKNRSVIAINQDELVSPAKWVNQTDGNHQILRRQLNDGNVGVAFFNRTATNYTFSTTLVDLQLRTNTVWSAFNCWAEAYEIYVTNAFSVTVSPNDTAIYRFDSGAVRPYASGTNWLSEINWNGWNNSTTAVNTMTNGVYCLEVVRNGQQQCPTPGVTVMGGVTYSNSISATGTTNGVDLEWFLGRQALCFSGVLGTEDRITAGLGPGVQFEIYTNDTLAFRSFVFTNGTFTPTNISVSLVGADRMRIKWLSAQSNSVFSAGDIGNGNIVFPDWGVQSGPIAGATVWSMSLTNGQQIVQPNRGTNMLFGSALAVNPNSGIAMIGATNFDTTVALAVAGKFGVFSPNVGSLGAGYTFERDGGGILNITGAQAGFNGLILTGGNGEYARFLPGAAKFSGPAMTNGNSVWYDRTNTTPPTDANHIYMATDTNATGLFFVWNGSAWVAK